MSGEFVLGGSGGRAVQKVDGGDGGVAAEDFECANGRLAVGAVGWQVFTAKTRRGIRGCVHVCLFLPVIDYANCGAILIRRGFAAARDCRELYFIIF